MRLFLNRSRVLGILLSPLLQVAPVLAHKVETSAVGDVAATFHIEPSHNPTVGKPSIAWFALTRRGGRVIPLAQCNCQLAVYSVPHKAKTPPLMKPKLNKLDVERYKGVPAATITFPKAGMYELKLTGTAKPGANFQPFSLSYTVTVGG
ncbi:hypothetical protein JOY44_06095 [Phormidium sp. CLA17]|uniref:hypothetical protein n=1 Tax=Leptolyngbya sp. Cla-17 TaxID=2803751 RepID=UPI001491B60E|nr:hypothetical protein [Leptolyngbya sp. Cla-17]MBM0741193.1 hypothetical protein [Leptolyngbya sp. Cla-17]